MLIAVIPLLAAISGILMFVLAHNPEIVEIGRALMWCGILATLLAASQTYRIGGSKS